jgi:site-specific DNA-methyltransferase (adenine-specific)
MLKPDYERAGVTLYCGDCLDVLAALSDDAFDVTLTDPPWELSKTAVAIRSTGGVAPRRQESHTLKAGAVGEWSGGAIRELLRVVRGDCLILAGYKELGKLLALCDPVRGVFAWHKPNGAPGRFYPAALDLSFIVWTAKKSNLYGYQHWPSMVFSVPFPPAGCFASERVVDHSGKAVHPCQGPVKLYTELLRPFAAGTTVIDPYLGTGTTALACIDRGLPCVGVERDPKYFDIAVRRIDAELRQGRFEFAAAAQEQAE